MVEESDKNQAKHSRPRLLIGLCVFLMLANCLTLNLLWKATRIGNNQSLEHYRHLISIGDYESVVTNLIDSKSFINHIGTFERTEDGPVWTYIWVQGGPIVESLTTEQLKDNQFWDNLGWSYPTVRPTHKVIVFYDGEGLRKEYIYCYLDESGHVVAIYVGRT